ncbi:MAG TPA: hypothetical protein VE219_04305 [Candidatus Sulfotelmatobacter sp.]|nr:hypothetical protein [Candidatus Sulfotelmatobacter sp.]
MKQASRSVLRLLGHAREKQQRPPAGEDWLGDVQPIAPIATAAKRLSRLPFPSRLRGLAALLIALLMCSTTVLLVLTLADAILLLAALAGRSVLNSAPGAPHHHLAQLTAVAVAFLETAALAATVVLIRRRSRR